MALGEMARHTREAWEVPRDLILGRYPPFVTGGALPVGQVPVFVFHSLEPDSFQRKLRYLADNGYLSLSAGEYYQVLTKARPAPEKAVVLTFDDGRRSLFTVGFPLLKTYGMKGIVFLIPGRTPARAQPGAEEGFLSWDEVQTLSASGLFDFQSHTLTHSRVHTSPKLAGFMTPPLRGGYRALDVPLVAENGRDLTAPEVPLGTPLFRSEPRTSEALRFREDPALRAACVEKVAAEGKDLFFLRRGWERELRRLVEKRTISGRMETPQERESAIRKELADAKRLIEERTGRLVVHLCYPWHVAGPTARRLAREVGYRTAFCGKVPGVPITLPGGDPHAIARIGEDYVELLPGRGRASLASVLRRKWSRRLQGGA